MRDYPTVLTDLARLARLATLASLLLPITPAVAVPPAPPPTAEIRVEVTTGGDGSSIATPYVAVVAETSPWSEPTRQSVIEKGSTVTWPLPAGRYRIVVGAPGYAVDYGPVIDLPAGARHTETKDLVQLARVVGRVVDLDGGPVPRAVVSHLRRLVFDFSRRLSPLGESHLRPSFEATADETGRFRIALHPSAGQFLAVRAHGRTPRFFPNLSAVEARTALREVELAPGASVALSWIGDEEDLRPYDRLQLLPANRRFPSGLDLSLALAVWARPFPADGATEWPSLPPGEYEILLKAPPRGAHSVVPLGLGALALVPGARVDQRLELPPMVSDALRTEGGDRIDLLLPELPTTELEALRVTGWRGGGTSEPRELAFTTTRASGGLLLRVVAKCRPGATFELVTPKRIGSVSLDHGACRDDLGPRRVAFAPRGGAELRVVPPPGESLPAVVHFDIGRCDPLRYREPPTPRMHLAASIVARADGSGTIATPMAAGCASVIARIGAFAPISWPALKLAPDPPADLGSFPLRYGAALLVRVVSALDGRPVDGVGARVVDPDRAVAEIEAASSSADQENIQDPAGPPIATATTSDGGWARLAGLVPGRDLVLLLLGEGRPVPFAATDFELAPGEEKVLDGVELPPPTSLEVRVELSRRLEELGAEPYQVSLRHTGTDGPPVSFARGVGPDRIVVFEDLPAGAWRLLGIVRTEDAKPFPAGSAEVELAPGERRTIDLRLADSIYEGQVTYEGIPVGGSMSVSPVSPDDRRGMSVHLDDDGRFRLPLEGPGVYTARVYDERDRRFDAATVAAVRFDDPEEEVTIRLPEGRVGGVVVDADGEPVGGALVEVGSRQDLGDGRFLEARIIRPASSTGEFLAEALAVGDWTVTASAGELESPARIVPLAPGERVLDLELVVGPGGRLNGVVLGADGRPAAGARLEITPHPGSATEVVPLLRTATGADGRFELSTVHIGKPANLRIFTASGTATAIRTELGSELRIDLPQVSGPVEIELPCPRRLGGISGAHYLVSESGAFLPLPSLGGSERLSNDPCRIVQRSPGLAAGRWRIVQVESAAEETLLFFGQGLSLESTGELVARPGAPARVRVAEEESDSSKTRTPNER